MLLKHASYDRLLYVNIFTLASLKIQFRIIYTSNEIFTKVRSDLLFQFAEP